MASALLRVPELHVPDYPTSRAARLRPGWLAAAMLAVLLSGCSSLYLHNPEREAVTEKAKQQLSGVDLLSLTDQQIATLANYAQREDEAVVEYGLRARDQRLLSMFRPDLADKDSLVAYTASGNSLRVKPEWVRKELTDATDRRLADLICGSQPCDYQLVDVLAFSAPTNPKASEDMMQFTILETARLRYRAALKDAGRTDEAAGVKSCTQLTDDEVATWIRQHPNDADFSALFLAGEFLKSAEAEFYVTCANYQETARVDRAMISKVLKGGALQQTLQEVESTKLEVAAFKIQEAELAAAAQELEQSIQESETGRIGAATDKIEGLLKNVQEGADGVGLEKLADILDSLIRGEVDAAAGEAAGTASDNPDDAKLASLTAVSRLLKSSAAAAETFAGQNPIERLNSLLILRAGLQQKIDESRLYRGRLESMLLIAEAKKSAMESELYQLARARATLDNFPEGATLPTDEPLQQALSAYTVSWNRGRIPLYLASFKEAQVERTYAVKLYQATAKNYKALLEPAFAALEAYAKGGITPGDLAKVLAVTLFLVKFATL
jgi:hypothetical protein